MTFLRRRWAFLALFAIFIAAVFVQTTFWIDTKEGDIYYLYLDGQRIKEGQNPYSRVLESDMRKNDKYTTLFPAFIGLSYLTQQHRFSLFENWLALWRIPFLLSNLAIAGVLFWAFYRRSQPLLGLLAAAFWLFNRWTLFIVKYSGIDFIPIFLLLLSLLLLPKRRWWAIGLYSLSLAFKQVGIFLLPLYLIEAYHSAGDARPAEGIRRALLSGLGIASIPVLTALPFLAWDAKGFVYSIFFSATRDQFQFPPPAESLDMLLGMSGFAARLPMLLLLAAVYLIALLGKIRFPLAALLAMAVFVDFNAVFFSQYMPWFVMVMLFAIAESRALPRADHQPALVERRAGD